MFKRLSFTEKLHSHTEKSVSLEDLPQIKRVILDHENFVLVGHKWGDGDSFASMYGLAYLLKGMGKKVKILTDQEIPSNIVILLDLHQEIEIERSSENLQDPEVVIFVDIAERSEIDQAFDKAGLPPDIRFVEFDHHIGPGNSRLFSNSLVAFDRTSSTAELLYHFFKASKFSINDEIVLCIATGIVYDTGNFRFMTSERTLRVREELRRDLHVTFTEIFGDIHMLDHGEHLLYLHLRNTLSRKGTTGYFILRQDTLEKFTGIRSISQPSFSVITNIIGRNTDGLDILIFLCEIAPNVFKGGLRKYPLFTGRELDQTIDLRDIAAYFDGGGHSGAVGFTIELSERDDPKEKIKEILELINRHRLN